MGQSDSHTKRGCSMNSLEFISVPIFRLPRNLLRFASLSHAILLLYISQHKGTLSHWVTTISMTWTSSAVQDEFLPITI